MASKPLSLTLILAATPSLGIGQAGTLPWPQLRKEMGYFARVTKRLQPNPLGPLVRNAVIMGRKTWDSIPPKFRPLKDRLNVVVTRNPRADWGTRTEMEGPLVCGSLEEAVAKLEEERERARLERVYVIGGASLYEQALKLPNADTVLLTRIRNEFECDTFFPVHLEDEEEGWRKMDVERLSEVTGEEVGRVIEEKGVEFEFCGFERVREV